MSSQGKRLFWATVLGFVGGTAAVGYLLYRRHQIREEPASKRAERLLQSCQEKIQQIEQHLQRIQGDGRTAEEVGTSEAMT